MKRLDLAEVYYPSIGLPMIRERFADCEDRLAVDLVGPASECFGFAAPECVRYSFPGVEGPSETSVTDLNRFPKARCGSGILPRFQTEAELLYHLNPRPLGPSAIGGDMTEKDRIIEAILGIELHMFLTVNPMQTSGCQEDSESFKLHRRAQFAPWSEEALANYLDDLHAAQENGNNLMHRKYARMQGLLPPAAGGPILEEIVQLKMDWQRAMFRDYPTVMSGARPLTDESTRAQMTSFETYARGELETYSACTLELLHRDLLEMQARGESLSEKVYDHIVRASGYASLDDAEMKLKVQR